VAFAGSSRAENYLTFVIWRGIAGLFTGTIGTAYSYIADLLPPIERPTYFAYVTALISACWSINWWWISCLWSTLSTLCRSRACWYWVINGFSIYQRSQ
jgi:MFS family permease